jgi:hypothetical protein
VHFVLGALILAVGTLALYVRYGHGPAWPLLLPIAAFVALSSAAAVFVLRRKSMAGAAFAVSAALVLYPALTLVVAPGLKTLWVSARAASLVGYAQRRNDPPVAVVGYQEPSLVFLLGSETRLTTGEGAAEIGSERGGLALVEAREQSQFLSRAESLGALSVPLGRVDGLDYSRGKPVRVTLYRTVPAHLETEPPPE